MAKITATQLLSNEKFLAACKDLYGQGKEEYEANRFASIYEKHSQTYGEGGVFFSSPGRIEVCGNHTDHNNGKVLCASITVDTLGCVTPLNENRIIIASIGYPVVEVDITDLKVNTKEFGTSDALVRGVCAYFADMGYKIGGFAATTTSDVFKGAGVSSSASFEVLVSEILNQLYNNGEIPVIEKIKASHHAESVFFGKPCGLLDQSAIALGGISYIDFKSTKNPKIEKRDWQFDDLAIVLTNTGGDHCNLTDQYAAIRQEMEAVAKEFGVKKLRKVKETDFYKALPMLKNKVSGRAIMRAMHYFDENKRVDSAAKAIKQNREKRFNDAINASGMSSYLMLQNCYPLGDLAQPIPLGINISKTIEGVKAVRVHGGGFAGTIIAYVSKEKEKEYVAKMCDIFGNKNVYSIGVRKSGTCKVDL